MTARVCSAILVIAALLASRAMPACADSAGSWKIRVIDAVSTKGVSDVRFAFAYECNCLFFNCLERVWVKDNSTCDGRIAAISDVVTNSLGVASIGIPHGLRDRPQSQRHVRFSVVLDKSNTTYHYGGPNSFYQGSEVEYIAIPKTAPIGSKEAAWTSAASIPDIRKLIRTARANEIEFEKDPEYRALMATSGRKPTRLDDPEPFNEGGVTPYFGVWRVEIYDRTVCIHLSGEKYKIFKERPQELECAEAVRGIAPQPTAEPTRQ